MKWLRCGATAVVALAAALTVACKDGSMTDPDVPAFAKGGGGGGGGGGKPGGETAGNNLSFPVLWAEGVIKTPPGTPGMIPILTGEWWYQWGTNGTDPDVVPASCMPDPDESDPVLNPTGLPLCDDGVPAAVDLSLEAGQPIADNPLPLAKAYVQKDAGNLWQAGAADWSASPVAVDSIDWGDNLESVDWYTKSQVRTEVVLYQNLVTPMLQYEMRHTSGWGIDEAHGLAADLADVPMLGPGTQATVYSPCARLSIQKLLIPREDVVPTDFLWVPEHGWTEADPLGPDLVNPPIFNDAVYLGADGPGYYSAEINVKGKIIFGYTWNVRRLNDDGAGDYRATFSFDQVCGAATLNTFFVDGVTGIMLPEEEVVTVADEGPGGGAVGQLDFVNNLTYIDIRILERGGGGGGGKP